VIVTSLDAASATTIAPFPVGQGVSFEEEIILT
jgi:hypothetical protein